VASVILTARSALFGEATPGRYGARRGGPPEVKLAVRTGLALAVIAARKGKASQAADAVAAFAHVRPLDRPSLVAKDGVVLIGCAPGQWLAVAEGSRAAGFVAKIAQALAPIASVTDHTSAKTVVADFRHAGAGCAGQGMPDRSAPARVPARRCGDDPHGPDRVHDLAGRRGADLRARHQQQRGTQLLVLAHGFGRRVRL